VVRNKTEKTNNQKEDWYLYKVHRRRKDITEKGEGNLGLRDVNDKNKLQQLPQELIKETPGTPNPSRPIQDEPGSRLQVGAMKNTLWSTGY
jgi:hypothetical protein